MSTLDTSTRIKIARARAAALQRASIPSATESDFGVEPPRSPVAALPRTPPAVAAAEAYAGRGFDVSPLEASAMRAAGGEGLDPETADAFGVDPDRNTRVLPGSISGAEAGALTRMRTADQMARESGAQQAGAQAGVMGRFGANVAAGFGDAMQQAGQAWQVVESQLRPDRQNELFTDPGQMAPALTPEMAAVGGQAGALSQMAGQLLGGMGAMPADPITAPLLAMTPALSARVMGSQVMQKVLGGLAQRAGPRVAAAAATIIESSDALGALEAVDAAARYPGWLSDPGTGLVEMAKAAGVGVLAGGALGAPGGAIAAATARRGRRQGPGDGTADTSAAEGALPPAPAAIHPSGQSPHGGSSASPQGSSPLGTRTTALPVSGSGLPGAAPEGLARTPAGRTPPGSASSGAVSPSAESTPVPVPVPPVDPRLAEVLAALEAELSPAAEPAPQVQRPADEQQDQGGEQAFGLPAHGVDDTADRLAAEVALRSQIELARARGGEGPAPQPRQGVTDEGRQDGQGREVPAGEEADGGREGLEEAGQAPQPGDAQGPGGEGRGGVLLTPESSYAEVRAEATRLGVWGTGPKSKAALLERIQAATEASDAEFDSFGPPPAPEAGAAAPPAADAPAARGEPVAAGARAVGGEAEAVRSGRMAADEGVGRSTPQPQPQERPSGTDYIPRDALGAIVPRATINGTSVLERVSGRDYPDGGIDRTTVRWSLHSTDRNLQVHSETYEAVRDFARSKGFEVPDAPPTPLSMPRRTSRGDVSGEGRVSVDIEHPTAARAQTESDALDKAKWADAQQVYLRFGDLPASGRSRNSRDNRDESGVSVFRGLLLPTGEARPLFSRNDELGSFMAGGLLRRPLYVVSGQEIGVGSDGEPVLTNAKVVRRAHLYDPTEKPKSFDRAAPAESGDADTRGVADLIDAPYAKVREEAQRLGVFTTGPRGKAALIERIRAAEKPPAKKAPRTLEQRVAGVRQRAAAQLKSWLADNQTTVRSGLTTEDFKAARAAAIWVAAGAIEAGVRGGKALSAYIQEQFKGSRFGADHLPHIRRIARGILRDSAGPDGAVDGDRFERAVAGALRTGVRRRRVSRKSVDEAAGVKRPDRKVSERAALKGKLGFAERATSEAWKLGRRAGHAEELARAKEKIASMEARVKAREGSAEAIREEAVALIRENVPPHDRGRLLTLAARATTLPRMAHVIRAVRGVIADREMRLALAEARRARKRVPRKLTAELREEAEKHAAQLGAIISSYRSVTTIRGKVALAERLRDLRNTFLEIKARQKHTEQVIVEGKVRLREAAVEEIVDGVGSRKELPSTGAVDETRMAHRAERVHQKHLTADTIAARAGSDVGRTILAEDAWRGETAVNKATHQAMDGLQQWAEEAGFTWGSDKLQRLSAVTAGDQATRTTFTLPDAGELAITPAQAMALYATIDDARAGAQILAGTPVKFWNAQKKTPRGREVVLSMADVNSFLDQLDPKLREIVDKAKAYIEAEVRPGLFAAVREQLGYDLEAMVRYWRTRRDVSGADVQGVLEPLRKSFNRSLENLGFLKPREVTSKTAFIIGDFFQDYSDIVYQGNVVAHMTRAVRNAEMVFKDPRVRAAIESRFGDQMNQSIDRKIEAMKLMFSEPKTGVERLAGALKRNMARSVLQINPGTWLKQLGGVFKLLGPMETKYVLRGLAGFAADPVGVMRRMRASPYFRDRYESAVWRRVSPAFGERLPLLGKTTTASGLVRAVRGGLVATEKGRASIGELVDKVEVLNWFDSVVSAVAWAGAEAEAKDRGIARHQREEFVSWQAEKAIRRTQNTHSQLDMSDLAEQHRGNPLATLPLMFTSDANKSYNMVVAAANESPAVLARTTAGVTLNNAWAAAVTATIRVGLPLGVALAVKGGLDDDEQRRPGWARVFLEEFIGNSLGIVYGGREAADLAETAIRVMERPGIDASTIRNVDVLPTPVGRTLNEIGRGFLQMLDASTLEGEFESGPRRGQSRARSEFLRGLEKAAMGLSKVYGIPVEPVYRLGKRALDAATSD